jgi:DNA-binding beta-propeller fold protein YncE
MKIVEQTNRGIRLNVGAVGLILILLAAGLVGLPGCGAKATPLDRPNGVTVTGDGSIYVMDFGNHRIIKVTEAGKIQKSFGSFGKNVNQIFSGWDLATDKQGNLYFGNIIAQDDITTHDGVKIFSGGGQFIQEVGGKDYDRNSTENPNSPYGVDVDEEGRIYVANYSSGRLTIFDAQGNLLAAFFDVDQGEEPFDGLNDVAVDDSNGHIYLTNFDTSQVEQYQLGVDNSTGYLTLTHLRTIGEYGRRPGQLAFPQNLAVNDRTGVLYVGDLANRRIQAFDAQGQFLLQFSPPDVDDWQVMGLATGPDNAIYAADSLNNVVWVFEPDGQVRSRIEVKP